MSLQSINPCVNPAGETISLGPIEVRFLITGENSSGTVAVLEVVVPAARRHRTATTTTRKRSTASTAC